MSTIHGYPKSRRSQFLANHARRLSVGVWTGYAEEELACYVDETLQASLFNESSLKRFRWTSRLQRKVNQLKLILMEGQGFTIPGSQILGTKDISWPVGVDMILGLDFLLAHQELYFIVGTSGTYLPQRFLKPPATVSEPGVRDQLEVYTDTYRQGSKVGVGVFFGPVSRKNSWYLFELDDDALAATWAIWCVLCVVRKLHPDIPEKPVTIYTTSDMVYRGWISPPPQVGDGSRDTEKSSGLAARRKAILKLASSIATEFHVPIQSIYCVKPTPNGIPARQASRLAKLATEGIEGLGELISTENFYYKIQTESGDTAGDRVRIYRFDRNLVRNTLGMIRGDFLQAGESDTVIPDDEEGISFPHPPFTLNRLPQENHVANGGGCGGDILEGLVESIAETIKKSLKDKLVPQYSNGVGVNKSREGLAGDGQLLLEASAESKRLRMQAAAEIEEMKNTAMEKTEAEIGEIKKRVAVEIASRYQKATADIEERYHRLRVAEDEIPTQQLRLDIAEKEIAERRRKADAEISEKRKNVALEIARARQSLDAELEGLRNQVTQPRASGNAVQAKMALHEARREHEQKIRELKEFHSRAIEDLINKGRNASARDRAAIIEVRGWAAAQTRSDKEMIARLESEVRAFAKLKDIETSEWRDKVSMLEGRLASSAKKIKDLENAVAVAGQKRADEAAKAREAAKKEKQKLAAREKQSQSMVKELEGREARLEEKAALLEARTAELKEIDARNQKSKEELAAQQAENQVQREELLAKERDILEREDKLLIRQETQAQEAVKKLEEISAKEVQILNLQEDLATLHEKKENILESARTQKKNIIAAAQTEKERVLSRLTKDKEATGREIAAMNSNFQALKKDIEAIRMEKEQLELDKERAAQHLKEMEGRGRAIELLQKALRQRAERIILDAKVEAERAADKIAYVGSVLHGREPITPQTVWDMYIGADCPPDHWLKVLNTKTRGFTMRQMIDHNPDGMVRLLEDLKRRGRLVHAVELWRDRSDANGGWKYKKGERLFSPAKEEQAAAFERGDLGLEPLSMGDIEEGDSEQVQEQGVEVGA